MCRVIFLLSVLWPKTMLFTSRKFWQMTAVGQKGSTTCLLQNMVNFTHQMSRRQLYTSRYSQAISPGSKPAWEQQELQLLLREKWQAYNAVQSRGLKEPGSWVHIKCRNYHKNLEHLPGAHKKLKQLVLTPPVQSTAAPLWRVVILW